MGTDLVGQVAAATLDTHTILLVEDDQALAEVLRDGLTGDGYVVCLAASGAAAEALVRSIKPDVILLDLMLPDEHGLVLCANLKQQWSAPIIVYSGTRRRDDAALAFKLGAADFVLKPVALQELKIRIERVLQVDSVAKMAQRPMRMNLGPLQVDAARHLVTVAEQELATTPTEYRLLFILVDRADDAVSVKELAEAVWEHYDSSLDASVRVHLRRLRAKLRAGHGPSPDLVVVRGFGYRLVWDPARSRAAAQRV